MHVIADAHGQGGEDRGLLVGLGLDNGRGHAGQQGNAVHHHHVLLAGGTMRHDAATPVHGQVAAVEEQGVLAPGLVDIEQRYLVLGAEMAEDGVFLLRLAQVKGRGSQIDEQFGPGRRVVQQVGHRVGGVELPGEEILVVPDILADGDAQGQTFVAVWDAQLAGLEVAGLVKDIVAGQQPFVGSAENLAVFKEDGAVVQRFAGGLGVE